jgi:hypothetical protein
MVPSTSRTQRISMSGELTEAQDRRKEEGDEPAPKPHYLEIENLNTIPLWLAPCHLIAALFQCMQSLFLFAFSGQIDLRWFVYTNFPTLDELGEDEYAKPEPHEIASYSITWYAGVFILLSGIDHISCIIPRFRKSYEYYVERSQSPYRWIEYSLSSPLMKMHIAQVAGVTDIHILFLIFCLGHTALYFAALHEKLNAKARADGYPQNWFPFWAGSVPHMACWSVIFCYFFTGLRRGDPSAFLVSTIVFSLFFLDMCFPLCMYLQWKKIGIFKDYLVGEFGFIMLSFTAKTFLAWVTVASANRYGRS